MNAHLQIRKDRLADALSLLTVVLIAVAGGVLIILLTSDEPQRALAAFFAGPFSNRLFFGNMLQAATPLLVTGLGLTVAFRAGAVNLGAEGQIYIGALAGTALLLLAPGATGWLLLAAIPAAMLAGALFAGLAGWLRTRFGATEVITTYLIGAILIQLFDFLLRRYLVDPGAGFPATESLPASLRLPRLLLPSNLNASFIIALLLAVLVWWLLYRTVFGYELRGTGANPHASRYVGIPVARSFVLALAISGALAGLAGMFEVAGVHGRLVTGFSNNIGWNGITVALIARLHPLGVVPAALLYGYLEVGANSSALMAGVSPRIAAIIQSLIFYLISAQALFAFYRRRLARRREAAPA